MARDHTDEGGEGGVDALAVFEAVAAVWGVKDPFRALETVPVQIERVLGPVAVIRAQDEQLWQGQAVPVTVRVFEGEEALTGRGVQLLWDAGRGVVVDLLAELAV